MNKKRFGIIAAAASLLVGALIGLTGCNYVAPSPPLPETSDWAWPTPRVMPTYPIFGEDESLPELISGDEDPSSKLIKVTIPQGFTSIWITTWKSVTFNGRHFDTPATIVSHVDVDITDLAYSQDYVSFEFMAAAFWMMSDEEIFGIDSLFGCNVTEGVPRALYTIDKQGGFHEFTGTCGEAVIAH